MTNITIPIEQIKILRSETLIDIKECKLALIESKGNIQLAKKYLKKKGLDFVEKRKYRRTSNGVVYLLSEDNKIAMLELTCETEFVSINKIFLSTADKIARLILDVESNEITEQMKIIIQGSIAIIKENMVLRKVTFWKMKKNEYLGEYLHDDNKTAVIVKLGSNRMNKYGKDKMNEMSNKIAMHICANKPLFISKKDVTQEYISSVKHIESRNKIEPRISEENISQICLMDQRYVKDQSMTIKEYISKMTEPINDIKVLEFMCITVEPFIMKYN